VPVHGRQFAQDCDPLYGFYREAEHSRSAVSVHCGSRDRHVRVRLVIPVISRQYRPPAEPQTEWTLAQGISDLADYRVTVAMCSLLDKCSLRLS
jgi:hypothetical protein